MQYSYVYVVASSKALIQMGVSDRVIPVLYDPINNTLSIVNVRTANEWLIQPEFKDLFPNGIIATDADFINATKDDTIFFMSPSFKSKLGVNKSLTEFNSMIQRLKSAV